MIYAKLTNPYGVLFIKCHLARYDWKCAAY